MGQTQSKKVVFVILILIVIYIISGCKNNADESSNQAEILRKADIEKENQKDEYSQLDDRVVSSFLPKSAAAFKYNSPTIVDDNLYIGTSTKLSMDGDPQTLYNGIPDNYFYKMELDLRPIWEYPLGKTMVAGSAVLDSQKNIYFLTETFVVNQMSPSRDLDKGGKEEIYLTTLKLVSLSNDGDLRWEKTIGEENEKWDHAMFNIAISQDDILYLGHEKFYSYDTMGNERWEYPKENSSRILGFSSAPIIDQVGNVYFVSSEPTIYDWGTDIIRAYKFTPQGTLFWDTQLGNELRLGEGPTKVGGSRVSDSVQKANRVNSIPAFGLYGNSLYALVGCTVNKVNTSNGKLLWSMKPEGATGSFIASPAIDDQDNLYVGTKSNTESTLFAVSSEGKLIWKNLIGADLYTSPLIGDDNMIYIGSETNERGKYYKIDMRTGEIKWIIGKSFSDFTLDSGALYQGHIYIGVHETPPADSQQPKKSLFKIKVDSYDYLPGAAWPRFHGGNDNSGRQQNK